MSERKTSTPEVRLMTARDGQAMKDTPNKKPDGALSSPVLVCMADVQPERVKWLWPGRIPLGKITTLAGDPGLGKSFVTIDLAARISNGSPWPDDLATHAPTGGAVLLTAEDDLGDTVRPDWMQPARTCAALWRCRPRSTATVTIATNANGSGSVPSIWPWTCRPLSRRSSKRRIAGSW